MKYMVTLYLCTNGYRDYGGLPPERCTVVRIVQSETMWEALRELNIGDDCARVEIIPIEEVIY